MDIKDSIEETLIKILEKLELKYASMEIIEEEDNNFIININSENPSHFIGHHGDNIQAIQHLLKVLCYKKNQSEHFNILLDVDEYRKRQETNVLNLAERKIQTLRKTGTTQHLPPMSPYLRRKVHLLCMNVGNEDIETISQGERDRRHIVLKLKS